uniref:LAGLIDADG endonuclease n=1 Tax=Powellomyces hirtus TaxID=109895 RepID=A0A4P8NQ59_9FUNG|nr:LAGLIDADG endonuclease [Powellomyces hirtus]
MPQNLLLLLFGGGPQGTHFNLRFIDILRYTYSFTPFMRDVLTGLMLGDGCLILDFSKRSINPCLSFSQSLVNVRYFLDVWIIFNSLSNSMPGRPQKRFDSRTGKTYYTLQFISRNAYAFWVFYEAWYPNGYKVIPDSIFEDLTPAALAHWIMCDGSANGYGLCLATQGFTFWEATRLASILIYKFGLVVSVQNQTYTTGVKPRLYVSYSSMPALVKIVRPFFSPSMAYKLGKHW